MSRFIMLLVMCGWCGLVQAGELYRWVDAQGKVHYGDAPPADAARVETKHFSAAADADQTMPYETRRAQQNFPVTLFVSQECGEYCDQARGLLDKRGIPFGEKVLVSKEEIDAFKAASGHERVPTLQVGRNYLGDFRSEVWHKELDIAGYPKQSSYRPAPPPAPASDKATKDKVAAENNADDTPSQAVEP
ncbi:MAG: DUF4124 domain-containing protein [Pseudomonadota bacterium]